MNDNDIKESSMNPPWRTSNDSKCLWSNYYQKLFKFFFNEQWATIKTF